MIAVISLCECAGQRSLFNHQYVGPTSYTYTFSRNVPVTSLKGCWNDTMRCNCQAMRVYVHLAFPEAPPAISWGTPDARESPACGGELGPDRTVHGMRSYDGLSGWSK